MKFRFNFMARAAGAGLALLALSQPARADIGTNAGTNVSNTATVDYQIGGTPQTQVTSNTVTFKVDRIVNLTVAEVANVTTYVQQSQTNRVTAFTVQNLSNDTLDFRLAVTQLANGATATHGGTDSFDMTNVRIFRDSNTNNQFDSGTDTQITYIDELAEEGIATIFVVADTPSDAQGVAGVTLKATARAGGSTDGSEGAALVNDTDGDDPTLVENVFNDPSGTASGDVAKDGSASDDDDYTTESDPTITKTARVVDDPVNATTNPKAIPGATIEYCVKIKNDRSSTIEAVTISDNVPSDTNYVAGSLYVGGTVTGSTCNQDGTLASDAYAAGSDDNGIDTTTTPGTTIVRALIPSLATGATTTVRFRVTIK